MKKVYASLPTKSGLMLWEIYFQGKYYDSDPRMSGNVPIDDRYYVVAQTQDEAFKKFFEEHPEFDRELKDFEKLTATTIVLENLIPARESANDGRLGFRSTQKLGKVQISGAEPNCMFGVCCLSRHGGIGRPAGAKV